MENLTLRQSSNSTSIQTFEPETSITSQIQSKTAIAAALVGKWIELERVILKAPEIHGRLQSEEEVKIMEKMMMRYASLTPKEIGDAMRAAAEEAQKGFAANSRAFPRLYLADIEDECQKAAARKIRAAEQKEALQLPKNTGGNVFWGKPSEALQREWPKIVEQTKTLRQTINMPTARDRFWYGGSPEQRDAARQMLRQMVIEMNAAGKWDLKRNQSDALKIFQLEFCQAFPMFGGMIDGMDCPLSLIQVIDIEKRLQRLTPDTRDFPDIDDCKFCAVFDAYWTFWHEKQR